MEDVTLAYAKEHLEALIERAAAGEDVRIAVPTIGSVQLTLSRQGPTRSPSGKRMLGQLAGKMTVPTRLLEPMDAQELADWYGVTP